MNFIFPAIALLAPAYLLSALLGSPLIGWYTLMAVAYYFRPSASGRTEWDGPTKIVLLILLVALLFHR